MLVDRFQRTWTLRAACAVATVLPPPPGHRLRSTFGNTIVERSRTSTLAPRWHRGIATDSVPTRCTIAVGRTWCKHAAARAVKRCSKPSGVLGRPRAAAVCANSSSVAWALASPPKTRGWANNAPVNVNAAAQTRWSTRSHRPVWSARGAGHPRDVVAWTREAPGVLEWV